jgi:actin-related protein 3
VICRSHKSILSVESMQERVLVMDNGTGYTKMGYAGNLTPSFDIPTLISDMPTNSPAALINSNRKTNATLDFFIGEEASQLFQTHRVVNPISGGIVRDWDLMERFWHRCIFDYMRCDPEQTVMVLTEPPLNPPENREQMAEIMFETFNVKGLHIGVQAVLALISSSGLGNKLSLTGTVLDSGDGVTHVIPISDGYVIGSCIKHIPLAGSNITQMIGDVLQERR